MKITAEQLAELKKLVDAATPGPWLPYDKNGGVVDRCGDPISGYYNSALMAASRTAIPALISALEESQAEIAKMMGMIPRQCGYCCHWVIVTSQQIRGLLRNCEYCQHRGIDTTWKSFEDTCAKWELRK